MDWTRIIHNKGFRLYIFLFIIFFICGAFILFFTRRGDVVLLINRYSCLQWDSFFNVFTDFGLGSYMSIATFLLVFYKLRHALTGFLNLALISFFTDVLKDMFREIYTRPLHYFLYDDFYRFIYTADLNYYSSFPSGHTMTVFGMLAFFAFLADNRIASVFLFVLSLLVGFSRIYMLQHFFVDVYVGACLGLFSLMITIWLTEDRLLFLKRGIFDRSIQQNIHLLIQRKS